MQFQFRINGDSMLPVLRCGQLVYVEDEGINKIAEGDIIVFCKENLRCHRIRKIVDLEISIGDYVLTGGEYPAMVVADSIIRLVPGVIEEESHLVDSFNNNLLDYETYTKPQNFRGMEVPSVLLSGDHKKIDEFRQSSRYNRTKERRPDLLD